MQKRSHKLLAATLLENTQGFQARRFELAFLFGSFQPDCNPLTYLKGSLRAYLEEYLATRALRREKFRQDVADALQELHRQYMAGVADMRKDVQFILKATSLLMAGCLPASAAAAV